MPKCHRCHPWSQQYNWFITNMPVHLPQFLIWGHLVPCICSLLKINAFDCLKFEQNLSAGGIYSFKQIDSMTWQCMNDGDDDWLIQINRKRSIFTRNQGSTLSGQFPIETFSSAAAVCPILLAPTGALIVMMVFYISGSGSNFFRISLSPLMQLMLQVSL